MVILIIGKHLGEKFDLKSARVTYLHWVVTFLKLNLTHVHLNILRLCYV